MSDITSWLPTRLSAGPAPPLPAITQRTLPDCTAWASHVTLTWLSRPEKPPRATTSASVARICDAAPLWAETAIEPPPWLATQSATALIDVVLVEPNGPP